MGLRFENTKLIGLKKKICLLLLILSILLYFIYPVLNTFNSCFRNNAAKHYVFKETNEDHSDTSKMPSLPCEQLSAAREASEKSSFDDDPSYYLRKLLKSSLQLEEAMDPPRSHSLQIMILTSWRSGSTFLLKVMRSQLGTFTLYEPLHHYGITRLKKSDEEFQEAETLIHNLLRCRDLSKDFFVSLEQRSFILNYNERYKDVCQVGHDASVCYDKSFFELACKVFPKMVIKIIRASLDIVKTALLDPSLNPKVILLVRDPRGAFNSRKPIRWCKDFCKNVTMYCQSMEENLNIYIELNEQFLDVVQLVRYEDLTLSLHNQIERTFGVLGLNISNEMEAYIERSLKDSTFRLPHDQVMLWTTKSNLQEVRDIQNECSGIMNRLGYLPVNSLDGLSIEDVLAPLKIPFIPT